jgi:hypothetical protein
MEHPKKVNGEYTIPPEPNPGLESPFLDSELFTAETRGMEAEKESPNGISRQESPFLDAFEPEFQQVVAEPEDDSELEDEEMYEDMDEYVDEEMESENFDESLDELDDDFIVDPDDEITDYEREWEVEDEYFYDEAENMEYDECLEDETFEEYRAHEAEIAEHEDFFAEPGDEVLDEVDEEELAETEAWEEKVRGLRNVAEEESEFIRVGSPYVQETQSVRTGKSLRERIVMTAEKEWERWNRGNLRETDDEALKILADYYRTAVGERKNDNLGDRIWHSNKPWSAAFISWVMKTAGAGKNFHYSRGHHYYIAAAKQNKLRHKVDNPFWAYPITSIAPQPGDLVCNERANSGATYHNIHDLSRFRSSHVDIVTEVRPNKLIVVGGNTSQRFPHKGLGANTVGKKTIQTDDRGFILQRKKNQFFAIIRVREEETRGQPGTAPQTGHDLDLARAVRLNRSYGKKLGWYNHQDSIARFLGFTNYSPDEKTFARAVAEWQQKKGLEVDGVIGPETWSRIKVEIRSISAPNRGRTSTGIDDGPQGPFGSLTIEPEQHNLPQRYRFKYTFTQKDVIWLARFIVGEAGGGDNADKKAVIWAMFNRYALFAHKVKKFDKFCKFIRRYSTPLQPSLKSWKAAQRVWRNHYKNPEKYPVKKTGGFYKPPHDNIPRVQYVKFLKLQNTPWKKLPLEARSLAERALKGEIANPGIGIASEFANTRVYFRQNKKRTPTYEEWLQYTKYYARRKCHKKHKGCTWIGKVSDLKQMKENAFFIDNRVKDFPSEAIRITPPKH